MPGDEPGKDPPYNILARISTSILSMIAVLAPITLFEEFILRHITFSRVLHGICFCSHVTSLGFVAYLWMYLEKSDRAQARRTYQAICLPVVIALTLSTISSVVPLDQLPRFWGLLFQGLAAILSGLVAALEAVICAYFQRRWRIRMLMQRGKYQAALELLKPNVSGTKLNVRDILNTATCYHKLGHISERDKLMEQARAMYGSTVVTSNMVAFAYMEQQSYSEALAILESVSENDTDLRLWYKCYCLNAMNRNDDARVAWQRLNKSSTDAFLQSLLQNPDCRRVIESIEKTEPNQADG